MHIPLRKLKANEATSYSYSKSGRLPTRMRYLDFESYQGWLPIRKYIVVSDMYRSAESSLWAIENRKGALPPGKSGHGFGRSIDLDIKRSMKNLGFKRKRQLDDWMAARGWFCHRSDHRMKHEAWHYNYFGVDTKWSKLALKTRWRSVVLEKLLKHLYGKQFKLTAKQVQGYLKELKLYGGAIDGKLGPISKQAIKAFQRTWKLGADGVAGPKTKRVLAFVTATH